MNTQISNIALDYTINPEKFADRFLGSRRTTDDFGQVVGNVSETETISEFDTADIKDGQKNIPPARKPKGKSKRAGMGKKVNLEQLLAAPVSRTSEQTVEELAEEIKTIHAQMLKGQYEQIKAFSEMGMRFNKIRKAVMIEKDFDDPKKADSEFGKKLTLLGIGVNFIDRTTRRSYVALAGKLTQAKSFVTKAVNAYAKDPKGADKITKKIATNYARLTLTAPVVVKEMGLLGSTEAKPKADTLAKIVENVQNRVEKLEDVSIAQVIEALQKINQV
tara:strand:+ start:218 stop:1045 length:828 start_codon:yes stop_codon:yes gene_type:complete